MALALDTSNSICRFLGLVRDASLEATQIILSDPRALSRVSVVPYGASINLADFGPDVTLTGNPSDRCPNPRSGNDIYTDAPPSVEPFPVYPIAIWCGGTQIFPLTNDFDQLTMRLDGLANFSARRGTGGQIGLAWAWYELSTRWDEIWPADAQPLASSRARKVIILMTDGVFATLDAPRPSARTQFLNLCDNIKAENIGIFVIAFQTPTSTINDLRSCGTSEDHFSFSFSSDLVETYRSIASRFFVPR